MKSKHEYFVYVLLCEGGSLYTGVSLDVQRRFAEHVRGTGGRYTRSHTPLKIVFTEAGHTHSSALKREAEIKKLSKKKKLALIQNT